ncbi:hypothetical protein E2C01_062947 [Portunus trituberculatus]|uniref:Uncharacterized protein n=1 Tax=Portunus trituberculatus TaxID=210409 RepID=A0A5B7HG87_PORTR|nr:hypothetical protein [Portunus trituberculatus]
MSDVGRREQCMVYGCSGERGASTCLDHNSSEREADRGRRGVTEPDQRDPGQPLPAPASAPSFPRNHLNLISSPNPSVHPYPGHALLNSYIHLQSPKPAVPLSTSLLQSPVIYQLTSPRPPCSARYHVHY